MGAMPREPRQPLVPPRIIWGCWGPCHRCRDSGGMVPTRGQGQQVPMLLPDITTAGHQRDGRSAPLPLPSRHPTSWLNIRGFIPLKIHKKAIFHSAGTHRHPGTALLCSAQLSSPCTALGVWARGYSASPSAVCPIQWGWRKHRVGDQRTT